MNFTEAIEPVTILKKKSAELIRKARESGQPIVITQNGKASAVLQDVESYQRQRKALMLLKFLARGDHDYRRGEVMTDSEADRHFRSKLTGLKSGAAASGG